MSYEPAELARGIMVAAAAADGGCSSCANDVLDTVIAQFPDLPWESVWESVPTDEWGDKADDFHYFTGRFTV